MTTPPHRFFGTDTDSNSTNYPQRPGTLSISSHHHDQNFRMPGNDKLNVSVFTPVWFTCHHLTISPTTLHYLGTMYMYASPPFPLQVQVPTRKSALQPPSASPTTTPICAPVFTHTHTPLHERSHQCRHSHFRTLLLVPPLDTESLRPAQSQLPPSSTPGH